MKTKLTLLLFIILVSVKSGTAQFQIVYETPSNRELITISGYQNIHDQDQAFYIHLNGDTLTAASPYWIRWYRNGNSFDMNPHNDYLKGSTCFISQGGFEWSKVGKFVKSYTDSNFILARGDWVNCQWFESGYLNTLTYNSGSNFTLLSDVGMYDFEIDITNDNIIYGAGGTYLSPCKFWKSTDRGNSWNSFQIDGMFFNDRLSIKINPLNSDFITIASNKLWKSYNAGATLSLISDLPIYASDLLIDYVDSSLYVYNNGIYKSTNGGLNFFQITTLHCNVMLIDPDDHNILHAGTDNGLYRSYDAGNSWELYFSNPNGILGIVKYKNDGDTIFVSNKHSVYKLWESLVNIDPVSSKIPDNFSLLQNYPNPFNPSTHLEFGISNLEFVSLKVYNNLGKEIATLVNENKPAGVYSVEFDGSGLSSGVYFYRLEAGNFTETRRMILLK